MLLSVATGAVLAAQLYKWVDDKGSVEYRDTPPPPNAKKSEQRSISSGTTPTTSTPYSVQVASKNFPVVLWAYDCGDPCKNARAHLARRGVPYTEKDPKADLKAFEKLTGSSGVPVLFVGNSKLTGYLESDWDNTLDSAGYPRTAPIAPVAVQKPPAKAEAKSDAKGDAKADVDKKGPDKGAPAATTEQKPAPAEKPAATASDRSVPNPPAAGK